MGVILGIMLNGGALAPPQAREPRRSRTPSFLQARACRQHEKGGSWSMVDACGDCVALAFEQELYDVDYKPACISPTLDRTPWSPSGLLALWGHPALSLPVLGKGEGEAGAFWTLAKNVFRWQCKLPCRVPRTGTAAEFLWLYLQPAQPGTFKTPGFSRLEHSSLDLDLVPRAV